MKWIKVTDFRYEHDGVLKMVIKLHQREWVLCVGSKVTIKVDSVEKGQELGKMLVETMGIWI